MRIALFIPTLKQGGAERVITILANKWIAQGHEVHLILLENELSAFYDISSKVILHSLNFTYKGKINRALQEVKAFYKLRSTIAKMRPEFVLSFMTKYNVLVIIATMFLKVKVFVSDRSNPNLKLPQPLPFLRKHLYKFASGILAQTHMAKEIIVGNTGNKNVKVIPNPLSSFKFNKNVIKENIVLNVGRLTEEKGQKYLIDSFSKLNNDDWKLIILGEGKLRPSLERQVEGLKLKDKVILQGSVKNVDEWLAKSSIFAFSSISEGFPNALVEAMAFGLPCIAFDCDAGPRDIIENGNNGFLVELKNVNEFSKKMELLIEDVELREEISNKAVQVRQKLDENVIASKVLKFCSQK